MTSIIVSIAVATILLPSAVLAQGTPSTQEKIEAPTAGGSNPSTSPTAKPNDKSLQDKIAEPTDKGGKAGGNDPNANNAPVAPRAPADKQGEAQK